MEPFYLKAWESHNGSVFDGPILPAPSSFRLGVWEGLCAFWGVIQRGTCGGDNSYHPHEVWGSGDDFWGLDQFFLCCLTKFLPSVQGRFEHPCPSYRCDPKGERNLNFQFSSVSPHPPSLVETVTKINLIPLQKCMLCVSVQ